MIRATYKMFGDKLNLVSDSLRCAGMPDGDYELGGQPITMKNGKATLTGTDTWLAPPSPCWLLCRTW